MPAFHAVTVGSKARTLAPAASSRPMIARAGDSRRSSVRALNASPHTATVRDLESFRREIAGALAWNDLATIVAKVDATGPAGFLTDLGLLENRFQFQRCLRDWPPRQAGA